MTAARVMMTMAALWAAAPVAAQTAAVTHVPPPPSGLVVAPLPPTDPARLAAARPVIDRIWESGHYARVMHAMTDQFMPAAMARMMQMRPDELLAGLGGTGPTLVTDGGSGSKAPSATLGQMALEKDPYFQQRMTITLRVFGDEMAKVMTQVEPGIRDALAHAYGRRFTVAQLTELDRFFATPTGAAYAADATVLMASPDMAAAMQDFTPRLIKMMPEMIGRVTEATKDLPPPVTSAGKPPVILPVPSPKKKP